MGHVALHDRALARERHQLGMFRRMQHRLAEARHGCESRMQVDLLERARPKHLHIHLAGQGQQGRTIDLRIPQPGHQVSGSRAGDGQAGRRFAGQLGIAGTREGGRPFVANAVVVETPLRLLQAQRVGEAEIGMAHHAEHAGDAPVRHGFGHQVRDGGLPGRVGLQADVNAVLTDVNRKQALPAVFVAARGQTGLRVKVPAVPRTAEPALPACADFDGAFAQGAALVGAAVIHGRVFAVDVRQRHGMHAGGHRLYTTGRQLIQICNTMPAEFLFAQSNPLNLLLLDVFGPLRVASTTVPEDSPPGPSLRRDLGKAGRHR